MIHRFETIDSTNTRAKEMAAQGAPHGTTLIARHQTGGRGRMGRSFHSPAGGLYLSMVLRPSCTPQALMHLTCAVAVAACDAIEATTGHRPAIKWTNDLVFGHKKLGGILTELGFSGDRLDYAIVGIGINCAQQETDFPPELRSMATSLTMVTGAPIDQQRLETEMIRALTQLHERLLTDKAAILTAFRKDCITLGKEVSLVRGDEVSHAIAVDIDEDGALVVSTPDGALRTIASGEVSVRGMYGYV